MIRDTSPLWNLDLSTYFYLKAKDAVKIIYIMMIHHAIYTSILTYSFGLVLYRDFSCNHLGKKRISPFLGKADLCETFFEKVI